MNQFCLPMMMVIVLGCMGIQASCPQGDLNNDCIVNVFDYTILAEQWLRTEGIANIEGEDVIDLEDLQALARDWLTKKNYAVISEFLASNHDTLLDEDGDSSDWIELYNPTRSTVLLKDWYLTDNRDEPLKWKIPTLILNTGDFRIFFASGKDRTDPNHPLHTSFKLDEEDAYLALVEDHDHPVASSYDLNLDRSRNNISYGINQQSQPFDLITRGSPCKVLIPNATDNAEIGLTWTGTPANEPFDDGGWMSLSLGVGYGCVSNPSTITENENVALGKPATQSSEWGGFPASYATDGVGGNFSHTATGDYAPWWELDLLESSICNRIILHNRGSCCQNRLYNITIEIFDASGNRVYKSPVLNETLQDQTPIDPGESIIVDLSGESGGGVAGRRIRISKAVIKIDGSWFQEYLTLAEVEVLTSRTYVAYDNIALGQPATQSSEWDGYPASFATDGNLSNFTHTATGDYSPWWELDLQDSYFVNRIVLHNRDDCCQNRLYNILVEIFDAEGLPIYRSPVLNETAEGNPPVSPGDFIAVDLSHLPDGGVVGRRIHIRKEVINGGGQQEYLSLGEVQVYGTKTYQDSIGSNIEMNMKGLNASCYVRVGFRVEDVNHFDKVILRMKYDDGFIAYVNGNKVASSNAPVGQVWYDAQANSLHPGLVFEEFSVPLAVLRNGSNILAIQGLNSKADDASFLILPEVIAYSVKGSGTGHFLQPTPGKLNGQSVAGFVTDTRFDMDRGFYDAPFDVHITNDTPGSMIVFTTDGSEPSMSNGTQIAAGDNQMAPIATLHLATTTVLRARAFKDGFEPTNTDTQTYIFLDDVIASNVMNASITQDPRYAPNIKAGLGDLWTISIVCDRVMNDTTPVPSSVELIRPDGIQGFQADAGIKYFGGAFTGFDKKNFRLYFKSEFGATQLRYPLFKEHQRGIAATEVFDQLELRSGSHDMSLRGFMMSNTFTDDTMLDMGNLNPHGQFVHLYLNGTYWGVYHLRERWNADMMAHYLGGDREDFESINGNLNYGWSSGVPYDGDGTMWEYVKSLGGDYEAIRLFLDIQNYVDYMLMYMFGMSENEYRCVGPRGPGSGFKFYLNDADGYAYSPDDCEIFGAYDKTGGDGPGGIFNKLFAQGDPDYRMFLADRIHKHYFNDGAMTPARNTERLMQRCDQIQRAYIAESARWWGYNWAARTPLPDARNTSRKSWAEARDSYIHKVLPGRTATVIGQCTAAGFYPVTGAPIFQINGIYQHGGAVNPDAVFSMTLPGNSLYREIRLIDRGHPVRVHIPIDNNLGLSWTTRDFVPTGDWTDGTTGTGVGYEANTGYEDWIDTNILSSMRGVSSSVLCRMEFNYDDQEYDRLKLDMRYDDGFVAYLNGDEIVRSSNVNNDIPGSAFAFGHDAQSTYEEFDISGFITSLALGANVLAIHGINSSPTSSDMLVLPRLIGLVEDSNPVNDLVWFTTDGSDPRLSGGNRNPAAKQYTGPFQIAHSMMIKARTLIEGQWSALNEATYAVGPVKENLRITELMYHPADPNCEYIELQNMGAESINLNLVKFTNGVDFAFGDLTLAPGGYTLVVQNIPEFTQRYGSGLPIGGQYAGSLENAGERI
ncbi:MAG: hypothetical protein GX455_12525, partial [Phycisphaerae bacterium]|nr:hypothetical protein [Phycisphaerae bacterium]